MDGVGALAVGPHAAVVAVSAALYRGYLNEPTGIGAAARSHLLALHQSGHPTYAHSVKLAAGGRAPDPVDPSVYPEVAAIRTAERADVVLVHTPPENYRVMVEPGAYNIGLAVWETDRLPAHWPANLAQVDEIWVPSEFNRGVFLEAARAKPVHVVPHPVSVPLEGPHHFPGVPDDIFLFVSLLAWQDRKNPVGLVRAFARAFQGRSDVGLLLKLGWRVGGSLERAIRSLKPLTRGMGPWRTPPVFLIADEVAPPTLAQIYRRADAYVSLHRGEGFGLCMAEAMAAGVVVVATGYSGNLEYMDDSTALLVPYELVAVKQELTRSWFDASMHWAAPNEDAAVEALRFCVEKPAERQRIAAAGQARVRRELDPARIGRMMRDRLGAIDIPATLERGM